MRAEINFAQNFLFRENQLIESSRLETRPELGDLEEISLNFGRSQTTSDGRFKLGERQSRPADASAASDGGKRLIM